MRIRIAQVRPKLRSAYKRLGLIHRVGLTQVRPAEVRVGEVRPVR